MFVAMKTMDGQDPVAKEHYETMRTSKGDMATPPLELSICVPDNIGQILVEALRADPSKTLGDIVTVVPTLRDGTLIRLMQDGAMVFVGPYPCQFPNESVWAAAAKDKTLSLPVELRISTLRRMPLSSCCGYSPLCLVVTIAQRCGFVSSEFMSYAREPQTAVKHKMGGTKQYPVVTRQDEKAVRKTAGFAHAVLGKREDPRQHGGASVVSAWGKTYLEGSEESHERKRRRAVRELRARHKEQGHEDRARRADAKRRDDGVVVSKDVLASLQAMTRFCSAWQASLGAGAGAGAGGDADALLTACT